MLKAVVVEARAVKRVGDCSGVDTVAAATSDGDGAARFISLKVKWQHKQEQPFSRFRGLANLGCCFCFRDWVYSWVIWG